jgi:hypothetical protein
MAKLVVHQVKIKLNKQIKPKVDYAEGLYITEAIFKSYY